MPLISFENITMISSYYFWAINERSFHPWQSPVLSFPPPPFPSVFLSFRHQIFIRHLPVQHILAVENQWWIKLSVHSKSSLFYWFKIFSSCLFQRSFGQNTLMKFMGNKANMDNFHWVGEKVYHQPLAAAVNSFFSGGLAYINSSSSPQELALGQAFFLL